VKTPGQIAYEALCDANYIVAKNWYTPSWPEDQLTDEERAKFEYVAQAVRAQVIEECAMALEREKVEVADKTDVSYNLAIDHGIAAIRSLKEDG
jgi:hypothetical protein